MTNRERQEQAFKLRKDISYLLLIAIFGLCFVTFIGTIIQIGNAQITNLNIERTVPSWARTADENQMIRMQDIQNGVGDAIQ